jgi:hypothetical protein
MARSASDNLVAELDGAAFRVARRDANRRKVSQAALETDAQGLVELTCECTRADCQRSVRVPLYVYHRLLEAGNQYLLQSGHHAFANYRTIVSLGLMRIEEKA